MAAPTRNWNGIELTTSVLPPLSHQQPAQQIQLLHSYLTHLRCKMETFL